MKPGRRHRPGTASGRAPALITAIAALLALEFGAPQAARAAVEVPDTSTLPDLSDFDLSFDLGPYVPEDITGPVLQMLSLLTAHRPYAGASSQMKGEFIDFGADVGFEAMLMTPVADFTLGEFLPIPSLPIARLHVSKALGPRVDVSASGVWFLGNYFGGAAVKILALQPPEGMNFAVRAGVSTTNLDLGVTGASIPPIEWEGREIGTVSMAIRTITYSASVVGSKKLEFAEPYVGAGYDFGLGQVVFPIKVALTGETQTLATAPSIARNLNGFLGVRFRIPYLGFTMAMEGSYSSMDAHTLGAYIGWGL